MTRGSSLARSLPPCSPHGHQPAESSNEITTRAQTQLLPSFCIDLAKYGVLGLAVARLILDTRSSTAYFIGGFVVDMTDLALSCAMEIPGIFEFNARRRWPRHLGRCLPDYANWHASINEKSRIFWPNAETLQAFGLADACPTPAQ